MQSTPAPAPSVCVALRLMSKKDQSLMCHACIGIRILFFFLFIRRNLIPFKGRESCADSHLGSGMTWILIVMWAIFVGHFELLFNHPLHVGRHRNILLIILCAYGKSETWRPPCSNRWSRRLRLYWDRNLPHQTKSDSRQGLGIIYWFPSRVGNRLISYCYVSHLCRPFWNAF